MDLERDIERVLAQEAALVLPQLDAETAWRIGVQLREMSLARGFSLAIDISRGAQTLFHAVVGTAPPDTASWLRRKTNTVARYHRSSYGIGLKLKLTGDTLASRYGLPEHEYAAHGGAFPLTVAGTGVIGVAAVSGLPQRADHELVVEALCAVLGRDYGAMTLDREAAQPQVD
jgi:uncharacterized protein (UPF0303 family)